MGTLEPEPSSRPAPGSAGIPACPGMCISLLGISPVGKNHPKKPRTCQSHSKSRNTAGVMGLSQGSPHTQTRDDSGSQMWETRNSQGSFYGAAVMWKAGNKCQGSLRMEEKIWQEKIQKAFPGDKEIPDPSGIPRTSPPLPRTALEPTGKPLLARLALWDRTQRLPGFIFGIKHSQRFENIPREFFTTIFLEHMGTLQK